MILDMLEENNRYELLFARLMEEYNYQILTEKYACDYLNVSRYKLYYFINELNSYLENNEIKVNDESVILYSPITTIDLEKLKYTFILQSKNFLLLHSIVEGKKSIKSFAKKEYLSLPQAYRKRGQLSAILKEEIETTIKGMSLISENELAIRNGLFDIYFYFFGGFEFPFPQEISDKYVEIEQFLLAGWRLRLSKTDAQKLKLFLFIQLSRISSNNILDDVEVEQLKEYIQFQSDTPYVLPEKINFPKNEELFLMTYIGLNFDKDKLAIVRQGELGRLVASFINVLEEELQDKYPVKEQLLHQSELIFANWLTFSNQATSFIEESQIGYFSEMYPLFHTIAFQFVNEYCRILDNAEITNSQLTKYYFDIIFLLIRSISLTEVESVVMICVDFSHGEMYNAFIKRNLENYRDLNIQLQDVFDRNTDIYLSDIYLPNLVVKQIIWRDPPTKNDWINFGDSVLAIKEKKIEKRK